MPAIRIYPKGTRSENEHIVAIGSELDGQQYDMTVGNRDAVLELIHGLVSALEKMEEFDSQNGGM